MKILPAVAPALVLCLAATSYGEFVFASSLTDADVNIDNGGTLGNGFGGPDGQFVTWVATGGSFQAMDVMVGFTYASGGAIAPGVTLYGLSTSDGTVNLRYFSWSQDSTMGNSDDSSFVASNGTNPFAGLDLPAAADEFYFTRPADLFNSDFAAQNYAYVILHFVLDFTSPSGPGSVLNIDGFSNPEPGTIALFALGAAGLGGFAVKRRRARLAARRLR